MVDKYLPDLHATASLIWSLVLFQDGLFMHVVIYLFVKNPAMQMKNMQ